MFQQNILNIITLNLNKKYVSALFVAMSIYMDRPARANKKHFV